MNQQQRTHYDEWTDRPDLRIRAFGTGRVEHQGRTLTPGDWTYHKAREMLFYLVCHPARTKEQIGLALWPDASTAQLNDSFRISLYHLRRALASSDWIVYEGGLYAFNRAMPFWFDVETFEFDLSLAQLALEGGGAQELLAADYLDRATNLYEGDFLDGTESEWSVILREDLLHKYLRTLIDRAGLHYEAGEFVQAAEVFRRAVAKDSYLEAAHRGLMRCLARQGELGQAVRHYQTLVRILEGELGAPPAPESVALYECLLRGEEC